MNKGELLHCYLNEDVLNRYLKEGLIEDKENYSDDDIRTIGMILSLEEMKFEQSAIKKYLMLSKDVEANRNVLLALLKRQRQILMQHLHQEEKRIDCIDCFIFKMKGKKED